MGENVGAIVCTLFNVRVGEKVGAGIVHCSYEGFAPPCTQIKPWVGKGNDLNI